MKRAEAEEALADVVASLRMEGMICTEEEKELGMKILMGEMSADEARTNLIANN